MQFYPFRKRTAGNLLPLGIKSSKHPDKEMVCPHEADSSQSLPNSKAGTWPAFDKEEYYWSLDGLRIEVPLE